MLKALGSLCIAYKPRNKPRNSDAVPGELSHNWKTEVFDLYSCSMSYQNCIVETSTQRSSLLLKLKLFGQVAYHGGLFRWAKNRLQ